MYGEEMATYEGVVSDEFIAKYLSAKPKAKSKSMGKKTVKKSSSPSDSYRVPKNYQDWKHGFGYRVMQYDDSKNCKK